MSGPSNPEALIDLDGFIEEIEHYMAYQKYPSGESLSNAEVGFYAGLFVVMGKHLAASVDARMMQIQGQAIIQESRTKSLDDKTSEMVSRKTLESYFEGLLPHFQSIEKRLSALGHPKEANSK